MHAAYGDLKQQQASDTLSHWQSWHSFPGWRTPVLWKEMDGNVCVLLHLAVLGPHASGHAEAAGAEVWMQAQHKSEQHNGEHKRVKIQVC